MRIKRVEIEGFRCLRQVSVEFDSVTTFIGPNGAGKSSILRALDWFFNATSTADMEEGDVCSYVEGSRVRVGVEFADLTTGDRERLGKYAPPSVDSVWIWREWNDGVDKMTGKALAYPPFEEIRALDKARDRTNAYKKLREDQPDLGLQVGLRSADDVENEMLRWEQEHPEQLVDAIGEAPHFFGFMGQAQMSGLFDFVFVGADLRAGEESVDSRGALLGRLIERTVDRKLADGELADLADLQREKQSEILSRHFGPQLDELSGSLTEAVERYSAGRGILVRPKEVEVKPSRAEFTVSVQDQAINTVVERQGHGFQRALLVSALQMLASRGVAGGEAGVICLAIEEPELFQHPLQARGLARTLRELAEDESGAFQATYASHSPYFIEPRRFDQIRRVNRELDGDELPNVTVAATSVGSVVARLDGLVDAGTVERQIDGVCLTKLHEALFSESAILVEGATDQALFDGVAERSRPLSVDGVAIAEVGGKTNLLLPAAVLELLGIDTYLVADGGSGLGEVLEAKGTKPGEVERVLRNEARWNRALAEFVGEAPEDFPDTRAGGRLAFFAHDLERYVESVWPEWTAARDGLVEVAAGFRGKDALTYREAARTAAGEPPPLVEQVLVSVRATRAKDGN